MKKTWLLNFENKYRVGKVQKTKKIKVSPKKAVNSCSVEREMAENDDDFSMTSMGSTTSTIVSLVADREIRRNHRLFNIMKNSDMRECGAGSPSGHISRQLNRPNPISKNIDKKTAVNLYSSHSEMRSFSQKPMDHDETNSTWDKRIYPSVGLFDNMTPRTGGVSKRKDVKYKPSVHREFVIREHVVDSVSHNPHKDSSSPGRNDEPPSNPEANLLLERMTYELHLIGKTVSQDDLAVLGGIKNPPVYVGPVFTYIYILIMGNVPLERRLSVKPPDVRKILLKETGSILQYLQQVRNACVISLL